MKHTIFTGAATAIITPFTEEGIDWDAFGRLIDFQLAGGINALVVAGTTGEGSTLTDREHEDAVVFCVKRVAGKVPVIAGTGSNNTAHAIERTKTACKAGADAVLLVTPYYNKTTQRGLIASFSAIADASDVPCILYNVPSRTGLNMLPDTVAALAKHEKIAAVKEACGSISQVAKELELCGDRLDVYSGNDDQTVPVLSLGGKGVISTVGNIVPGEMAEMCRRFFAGDVKGAAELQLKLLSLMNQTMIETNPIPVKAACAALGFCENRLRLPLVPMEEGNRQKLLELMKDQGLEVSVRD
jgi:4-hydroxy-tetrahydrodipicolinate synthase